MELPLLYADAMIQHAREEDPNECCGILARKSGAFVKHYRITNAEKSPYRFSMDSKELLRVYNEIEDNGWELAVIYHSHTHTHAYPSGTDIRLATWPDASYLIVSLVDKAKPDLRTFHIEDGKVTEESLRLTP